MCTLLFRHKPGDPYPLAVLSNRDEHYGRPSGGWEWRSLGTSRDGQAAGPRIFAPIDLVAGGTWMGLSEAGVLVALTNIFPERKEEGLHSRGALVLEVLGLAKAADAPDHIRGSLEARRYNNFNLLVADAKAAFVFVWTEDGMESYDLLPGVYQMANTPYGGTALSDTDEANEDWMAREAHRLAEHPEVCKHEDEYGTRSSAKILLNGADPARSRVWHLEGHPCQGEYRQVLGPEIEHAGQPAG
ncbi:MAG: NRDE family protein [Candidatus Neomarinimicrobiota bacterium]